MTHEKNYLIIKVAQMTNMITPLKLVIYFTI